MPTVLRVSGLRIVIYPNDHLPPHVHVIGAEGEARISIGTAGQRPALLENWGLGRGALAMALTAIDANRQLLQTKWDEIHGER